MIMLLTGGGNLRSVEARQFRGEKRRDHSICVACRESDETLKHLILTCTTHDDARSDILSVIDKYNTNDIGMTDEMKLMLIFGADENMEIDDNVILARSVYKMYNSIARKEPP